MKFVLYIALLLFLVAQQITCHASPAYVMYVFSWPVTLVACLVVELVVYGVLLHVETTDDDGVRRALSWTLYGIALAVPAWPAWFPVLAALAGAVAIRLARGTVTKHLAVAAVAVASLVGVSYAMPWRLTIATGSLVGWALVLETLLLLAYQARFVVATRTRSHVDVSS
ncbi:MAG: hypothetical protein H7066_00710 [Cytophagaceae bacterium]|nr:hypothetical protein [Gemmatimonadaceae bacterium]